MRRKRFAPLLILAAMFVALFTFAGERSDVIYGREKASRSGSCSSRRQSGWI